MKRVIREKDAMGRLVEIELEEVARVVVDPLEPVRAEIESHIRTYIHAFFEERRSSNDPAAELSALILNSLRDKGMLKEPKDA